MSKAELITEASRRLMHVIEQLALLPVSWNKHTFIDGESGRSPSLASQALRENSQLLLFYLELHALGAWPNSYKSLDGNCVAFICISMQAREGDGQTGTESHLNIRQQQQQFGKQQPFVGPVDNYHVLVAHAHRHKLMHQPTYGS